MDKKEHFPEQKFKDSQTYMLNVHLPSPTQCELYTTANK